MKPAAATPLSGGVTLTGLRVLPRRPAESAAVHELGGGKNAASAAVSRTAGNVVYSHTHQEDTATMVLPGVGLVKAWNPGCLCTRVPLWRHSNPTNWSHGYAVQFVAKSGEFLHINVPILDGRSLVGSMRSRM